jgi:TIR domain
MTDVFLSYAHDDQPFARIIAQGLEAEGLTVWWDHTIPPGKTWDTHIAAAIDGAKACIVIWSAHSVSSDWVKEEATLARDADKFLPVALDESLPPVGFRRIQAARLAGWTGDRTHPYWRLLVGEVRNLMGGRVAPAHVLASPAAAAPATIVAPAAPPPSIPSQPAPAQFAAPQVAAALPVSPAAAPAAPAYAPELGGRSSGPLEPSPSRGVAARLAAVVAVVAGLGVAGYFGYAALQRQNGAQSTAAAAEVPAAVAAGPVAVDTAAAAQAAEAERLRQERDAALAAALEAQRQADENAAEAARLEGQRRQAEEQARRQPAAAEAPRQQVAAPANMTGVWDGEIRWSTGSTADITWEYFSDGSMLTSFGSIGYWRASGQNVAVEFDVGARYQGALRNGVYAGEAFSMEGDPGSFEMRRR